jgi:hypothetical protein
MQQLTLGKKEVAMLSWLPRRHARIEIEAEAEALIRDFGEVAYSEAYRRECEASSHAIARDWGSVALAVAGLIGKRTDVDPLVRLAMNAVLVPDREDAAPRRRRSLPGLTLRKPRSLLGLTPEAELTPVIAPRRTRSESNLSARRRIADRRL